MLYRLATKFTAYDNSIDRAFVPPPAAPPGGLQTDMRTPTIIGLLALVTVGAASSPFGDYFRGCCTAHCCASCGGGAVTHMCGESHAAGCGGTCCECIAQMCPKINTKAACTAAHCTWTAAGKCAVPPPPPPPPPAPRPIVPPSPAPKCASGSDPLQVFIMLGQSNMLGMGHIGSATDDTNNSLYHAVTAEGKYPYLWDKSAKNWTTSKTTRNVFVMGSGGINTTSIHTNAWMNGGMGHGSIGPELGIGGMLEAASPTTPYMMLKSCIGNRALGWDLLPPGTKRSSYTDSAGEAWTYAGYHDSPMKWLANATYPNGQGWWAGLQYDGDIWRANKVLANLTGFFPSTPQKECFEVAGFFWWQGDKDSRDMGLSTHYEENLVALIKQLRVQYNAPEAKFVTASLGQSVMGATDGGGLILDAMLNVANGTKFPEFKGNVAAVYTHPLEHTPGSSGGHYGGDAQTYMNIGEAMGTAMTKMLKAAVAN